MRQAIKQTDVYQLSELSDSAKQTALQTLAMWATEDSFWYETLIEDAKEIGKIIGIDIDNIYFSGFSSQGDGACFTGSYDYAKGSCKAIREYAPRDSDLHDIADGLAAIQKPNFYQLSARVEHSGHYSHEYCTAISVHLDGYPAPAETYDTVTDLLRDFMRWIYKHLELEYEYCTSEETLTENADAIEYEFTESGEIY